MSRTWRRTEKGKKACHHKQLTPGHTIQIGRVFGYIMHTNVGADYFYWMTTPSHWNNRYHTRPRRAKERKLIHQIKSGYSDPDGIIFPDGKKPEIYFW